MKRTLLFTIIASVLTLNAYATSATVTSKDYVDTQDALKQNTIPATGTNSSTPGSTVVTYTGTAGTIGERGICNDSDEDDGENKKEKNDEKDCNGGDLVTVNQLDDQINTLPTTVTKTSVCYEWVANAAHTDANCLLWQLVDRNVYGRCGNHADCDWLDAECEATDSAGMCNTSTGTCFCGFR